jgi:hypothetical protein
VYISEYRNPRRSLDGRPWDEGSAELFDSAVNSEFDLAVGEREDGKGGGGFGPDALVALRTNIDN